jgi:hypothetical protein
MPAVGSSRRRREGRVARARAISRRRWSPYGRLRARSFSRPRRPTAARRSRARATAAASAARTRGGRDDGAGDFDDAVHGGARKSAEDKEPFDGGGVDRAAGAQDIGAADGDVLVLSDEDVLEDRHVGEEADVLERARDAEAGNDVGREPVDALTGEVDGAGGGPVEAGEAVEEGGLCRRRWDR